MLVAATRRGEPRCSSTHAVTDTSSPPSPLLAGGGGMDYCRRVNPFRMCAGLWVRGYLMVALVSAIVAVSYYTVVVYAWGPLLLGGGVAAAAAAAVLAAFHLLVNDAIIVGQPLVSCSSNTTLKVWNCLSDGACTRTLRQHSDYVICLAAADKNSNIVASGGLGGEALVAH